MSKNEKTSFWTRNKAAFIALTVLVTLAVAVGCVWYFMRPETVQGDKTITIEITHADQSVRTIAFSTDAEYLYDAMRQENLIGELDNGMFYTVDGETTDSSNKEWWGYTKSGEYVNVGVSECVIADGDHYEFNFNIGYDNW